MSVAMYVVLDRDVSGVDTVMDGKALAHAAPALERLCNELGVRELDMFSGANPEDLLDLLGDDPEHGASVEPGEVWYRPSDGLVTVRALIQAVESDAAVVPQPGRVLDDLRSIERILAAAEPEGARWSLAVDL
jgi:hypothetical protein